MNRDLMRACCGMASHIGGRDEQQDRAAIQVEDGSCLLIVADGMGGHRDGAVAAKILVEVACQLHARQDGRIAEPELFFNEVVKTAWQKIHDYAEKHNTTPHATVVMALIFPDGKAHWAHLGDARLYRLAYQQPPWRTADHSVVQMLLMEGQITEEEMADHPDQSRLWRSIGGDRFHEPKYGFSEGSLGAGEVILLCSDGLWEQMQPAEMLELASAMPPPEAAAEMVRLAAQRGGKEGDNVSVVVWVNY